MPARPNGRPRLIGLGHAEEVSAEIDEVPDFDPTADCEYTQYGDKRDIDPESIASMAFARSLLAVCEAMARLGCPTANTLKMLIDARGQNEGR